MVKNEKDKKGLRDIEPNHTIQITSPNGKFLKMNFNGDKLKLEGDLEISEGAKIFFESLDGFFQEAIHIQVNSKLEDKK